MVFKRMLGAFGVGGPSVDTVLAVPVAHPGGTLTGEVRLKGGDFDAEIEHITLGLVARVELEYGDGEADGLGEFFRAQVCGPLTLRKGEERAVGFHVELPWETPVSRVEGRHLPGMAVGVRTEVAIAKAVDKGDLDPLAVEPLPSQAQVLRGLAQLGYHLKAADLEAGHIRGARQELPFYQEIEFYPPAQHAGRVNEIELTFLASPAGLQVVLEADKRSGRYGDAVGRWQVTHEQALGIDWAAEIDRWVTGLSEYGHAAEPYHAEPYEHHGGHHGGHGLGGLAAAGAAGMVGGFLAAEAVEEVFEDAFEGDSGGDW
ncbi:sporulation protein [Thermoactinospora rubra]|uniref:sporulation protein n=1 Tax=Thermoactinospora rubra TaxID=1088767 RepID=UPI000A118162|nr:sporulation protein [Thermoactinospora rubra]